MSVTVTKVLWRNGIPKEEKKEIKKIWALDYRGTLSYIIFPSWRKKLRYSSNWKGAECRKNWGKKINLADETIASDKIPGAKPSVLLLGT